MTLVVWTTFALLLWIVLWSLGNKAFDAALVGVAIVLIAATVQIVKRFLPSKRS
jgi:hypothetical protein